MKYKVDISEILKATIYIEANNESEAMRIAKQMYNNCDIVLTADNFEDVNFNIMEETKPEHGSLLKHKNIIKFYTSLNTVSPSRAHTPN